MTVKELKELLKELPDSLEVFFEYDGPDSNTIIPAGDVMVYDENIIMVERTWEHD